MEHGQVCCKNFYRASNKEEDIQFEDPREECVNGDIIQCPSLHLKRRCTSDKLSEYSLPDCAVPFVVIDRYQGELIPIPTDTFYVELKIKRDNFRLSRQLILTKV